MGKLPFLPQDHILFTVLKNIACIEKDLGAELHPIDLINYVVR